MIAPLRLRPGEDLPAWLETVDAACFGQAWGPLEEDEWLWALPPWAFARWRLLPQVQEAELLRIAVAQAMRRHGLGRALLRHCQVELAGMGITSLFLEVRVANTQARALYEGQGWIYQGLRRGYYRDGEDAALYRLG